MTIGPVGFGAGGRGQDVGRRHIDPRKASAPFSKSPYTTTGSRIILKPWPQRIRSVALSTIERHDCGT